MEPWPWPGGACQESEHDSAGRPPEATGARAAPDAAATAPDRDGSAPRSPASPVSCSGTVTAHSSRGAGSGGLAPELGQGHSPLESHGENAERRRCGGFPRRGSTPIRLIRVPPRSLRAGTNREQHSHFSPDNGLNKIPGPAAPHAQAGHRKPREGGSLEKELRGRGRRPGVTISPPCRSAPPGARPCLRTRPLLTSSAVCGPPSSCARPPASSSCTRPASCSSCSWPWPATSSPTTPCTSAPPPRPPPPPARRARGSRLGRPRPQPEPGGRPPRVAPGLPQPPVRGGTAAGGLARLGPVVGGDRRRGR